MKLYRSAIEAEGAEVVGYDRIKCNLAESSVADRTMTDVGIVLEGLELPYAQDHYGHTPLRELIASQAGKNVHVDNVMITAGCSQALFIIAISLLEKGDHVVVTRPNYTTNIETPEALGFNLKVDSLKQVMQLMQLSRKRLKQQLISWDVVRTKLVSEQVRHRTALTSP